MMSVKKVLVIRFRRIGDAVLSVVICSSIRKSFPEAEIHYVLNDHIAPLFENHPDVDKVITFSGEENNHFFKYLRKVRQLMKTERYDVIIDTRATIKTLWFSVLSLRTKYRIGTSKFYNRFFHNYRIRNQVNDDLNEVERNLLLLRPLEREGKLVMTSDFRLYVTERETVEFRKYMEQKGIDFSRFIVVCAPFTRVAGKAWDMAKMKEILSRIIRRYDARLIFNYSQEEKAAALALYEEMGKDGHIFIDVEADSLRKLVSMLQMADFFFGNEGGPRHMAQACHLSGLAIYPPWVKLSKWLPSNDPRYQGVSPLDMFPGQVIGGRTGKEGFDLLTVEYVWERLRPMLDEAFVRKARLFHLT